MNTSAGKPDLSVTIAGVVFSNPVIAASGTFGYGREYEGLLDIASLGGICTKGLTLKPRQGNTGTRIHETPSGLMNSIGLENPGIPAFLEKELPRLRELGPVVIANLSGSGLAEYAAGAELLDAASVDMVELNISCPNVKAGGMAFGLDPEAAAAVTSAVRKALPHKPLMVKLSPNAPRLAMVARACVNAGADALSLVNTFKAMAIDVQNRRPVFDNLSAGLSGPAIRPIALCMIWELWEALRDPSGADSGGNLAGGNIAGGNVAGENAAGGSVVGGNLAGGSVVAGNIAKAVPIVGMGGIAGADDALEFLMAGAAAVQVGSATFARPPVMNEIIRGIRSYMEANGIGSLAELCIRQERHAR